LIAEMQELGAWADRGDPKQWFNRSLIELQHIVADMTRGEDDSERDYDGIEAPVRLLVEWKSKTTLLTRGRFSGGRSEAARAFKERCRICPTAGADLAPGCATIWAIVDEYTRRRIEPGVWTFSTCWFERATSWRKPGVRESFKAIYARSPTNSRHRSVAGRDTVCSQPTI
jgi:hypothetical protein